MTAGGSSTAHVLPTVSRETNSALLGGRQPSVTLSVIGAWSILLGKAASVGGPLPCIRRVFATKFAYFRFSHAKGLRSRFGQARRVSSGQLRASGRFRKKRPQRGGELRPFPSWMCAGSGPTQVSKYAPRGIVPAN